MKNKLGVFGLAAGVVIGGMLAPSAVQAATTYFSTTQMVQTSTPPPPTSQRDQWGRWSASATCPAGSKVTGGGATLINTKTAMPLGPVASAPQGNGWYAITSGAMDGMYLNVYAICVK